MCNSHFNKTNLACLEIHDLLQEMVNENMKCLGRVHAKDVLEMIRYTVNCGSAELTEDSKKIIHYLVKMHHSKSAILHGAEVVIEEDLDVFLTLENLNYLKLKTKSCVSRNVLLNETIVERALGMIQS